jgi:methylaspartate mutase epsilon subunit
MSSDKSFHLFIERMKKNNELVVQPRMGVSHFEKMGEGLKAVSSLPFAVVATLTVDSFTRNLEFAELTEALRDGHELNGFPLITYGSASVSNLIKTYTQPGVFVQVRHGSPLPFELFKVMVDAGIYVSEGGPISYCLPYSRVMVEKSLENWTESVQLLASYEGAHMESFGGCLLGQLCHPSLLVAVSLLEGLFFKECGIKDLSLSYAQGTHAAQDYAALQVLDEFAQEFFADCHYHRVLYTYMGLYPTTAAGARAVLKESVKIARLSGVERLVVKTEVESLRIPTFQENSNALIAAHRMSKSKEIADDFKFDQEEYHRIKDQVQCIIEAVLSLDQNIGQAIIKALHQGIIDVPYCLHPQNKNIARCGVDARGYLQWITHGMIPLHPKTISPYFGRGFKLTPDGFMKMLSHMQRKFDVH